MENIKEYHTVGTVSKPKKTNRRNRQNQYNKKKYMHPYHIYTCKHNRSHSLLGTDTLEVAELKKFYGPLVIFFFYSTYNRLHKTYV